MLQRLKELRAQKNRLIQANEEYRRAAITYCNLASVPPPALAKAMAVVRQHRGYLLLAIPLLAAFAVVRQWNREAAPAPPRRALVRPMLMAALEQVARNTLPRLLSRVLVPLIPRILPRLLPKRFAP